MSGQPDHIVVRSWFDVFPFDDAPTITCPDCETRSPELANPWAAVLWVDGHQRECPA